jgi:hypothetical protein
MPVTGFMKKKKIPGQSNRGRENLRYKESARVIEKRKKNKRLGYFYYYLESKGK